MDNKKLTINNLDKINKMFIGYIWVTEFNTTDDYYEFVGEANGKAHVVRIHRVLENPHLGVVKVVVSRHKHPSPKEQISIVHHISLLEDRSEWSRKMGIFMNNMVWEQK